MNGAKADPSAKTINRLINKINNTIGVNHHFFRTFRKSQIIANFECRATIPPVS